MSSAVVASEVPTETKPKEEEKKARAPKSPKEKKPKSSKPSSAASHPPYFQMIKEAIEALNEKTGSSPYAIAKHMEERHKAVLPANFRKILAVQLRNFAAKGKLVKVKASFKLSSDSGKKQEKKKPVTQKKEKRRTSSNKGLKTKKPVVKKTKRAVMAKAKQPKSIKSTAGKRARKASAA